MPFFLNMRSIVPLMAVCCPSVAAIAASAMGSDLQTSDLQTCAATAVEPTGGPSL